MTNRLEHFFGPAGNFPAELLDRATALDLLNGGGPSNLPEQVLLALRMKDPDGFQDHATQHFILQARACGVFWVDLAVCFENKLDTVELFASVELDAPTVLAILRPDVIEPGVTPDHMLEKEPSDRQSYTHYIARLASLHALRKKCDAFMSVGTATYQARCVAVANPGGASAAPPGADFAASLAEAFKASRSDPENEPLSSEAYGALLQAYAEKNAGITLSESMTPSPLLLAKVQRFHAKGVHEVISLKHCYPQTEYVRRDALGMVAKDKPRKIIEADGVIMTEEKASEFEKGFRTQDLVANLAILGKAYELVGACEWPVWQVHLENVKERVKQFPGQEWQVVVVEAKVRAGWLTWALRPENAKMTFGQAVRHHVDENTAALQWIKALSLDPSCKLFTRFASAQPGKGGAGAKGTGKGAYAQFGDEGAPLSKRQKKAQGRAKSQQSNVPALPPPPPSRKALGAAPKGVGKGGFQQPRNNPLAYHGPFQWNRDGTKICHKGASKAGCPRAPNCFFKCGVCPLPACGGAKHVAEEHHPQEWAEWNAAFDAAARPPRR